MPTRNQCEMSSKSQAGGSLQGWRAGLEREREGERERGGEGERERAKERQGEREKEIKRERDK